MKCRRNIDNFLPTISMCTIEPANNKSNSCLPFSLGRLAVVGRWIHRSFHDPGPSARKKCRIKNCVLLSNEIVVFQNKNLY